MVDEAQRVANADLVLRVHAARAEGDQTALANLLAPDVILHVPGDNPVAGTYHGLVGLAAFSRAAREIVPGGATTEILDVLGGAQYAAVLGLSRGQRHDRAPLDNPTVHLHRVADGRVAEIWFHNRGQVAVDAFWS